MRLAPNGPDIPNELLEARDQGEVVFFCGAGVSIPAGLPSFVGLARSLVSELGAPPDSASRRMLGQVLNAPAGSYVTPLDQILGQLQREYSDEQIAAVLYRCLKRPRNADLYYHQTVLRLSTDVAGRPRLVTTNFDLLFEAASKGITKFVPPGLPDLTHEKNLSGIVYLHGRLGRDRFSGQRRELILGTADFGRAYLAAGWATRFVRQLLDKYTVVLLGYSADDPPIRYLLEGLHSMPSPRKQRIYAFADASGGGVEARWSERGVVAIPYLASDQHHSELWASLSAWAERAVDPQVWRDRIVQMASRRPVELTAHERGQVASLVETVSGAKAFADQKPPPPAEWLCVLDARVRYSRPVNLTYDTGGGEYDPLAVYGVEDDPPRPNNEIIPGTDWLGPLASDPVEASQALLAGGGAAIPGQMTQRLFFLARWFSSVIDQPVAVWWAAGRQNIHPTLREWVISTLDQNPAIDPVMRQAWRLFLEASSLAPDPHSMRWYSFDSRLGREGWTTANIRTFKRISAPRISVSRPFIDHTRPPVDLGRDVKLRDLTHIDVEFLEIDQTNLKIENNNLSALVAILREGLEEAADIIDEAHIIKLRTPTLIAENRPGTVYHDSGDKHFLLFAELFQRMVAYSPQIARRELHYWKADCSIYFDKLRIWVSAWPAVVSAKEAVSALLSLSSERFWQSDHRRELLWTLKSRWTDFSNSDRVRMEKRIVKGPPQWADERRKYWLARKGGEAATMLGWLEQQGCELSALTKARLPALQSAHPGWRDDWVGSADESNEGRSGSIHTDISTQGLEAIALSKTAELAFSEDTRKHQDFIDRRPFSGLVKNHTARAVSVLAYENRHNRFSLALWQETFLSWPPAAPQRAFLLFAALIILQSDEHLLDIRYYTPRWIEQYISKVRAKDTNLAWRLWDRVEGVLSAHGPEATKSGLRTSTVGGVVREESRRTVIHALNSPTGPLVQALLNWLDELGLALGTGLPSDFRLRFERALDMPGEGRDHAITIITRQLRWLGGLDPSWVTSKLVPLFATNDSWAEPAWAGYLTDTDLPEPRLFNALKPSFLQIYSASKLWSWDSYSSQRLAEFLVRATYLGLSRPEYLTFSESRLALQGAKGSIRSSALWCLARSISVDQCWQTFIRPFLQQAWPRELKFQTAETSAKMVDIATQAKNNFPDVVNVVGVFLTPIDQPSTAIYSITHAKFDESGTLLATKFPDAALKLLNMVIPPAPAYPPYGLGELINLIGDKKPDIRQDLRWRRLSDLS